MSSRSTNSQLLSSTFVYDSMINSWNAFPEVNRCSCSEMSRCRSCSSVTSDGLAPPWSRVLNRCVRRAFWKSRHVSFTGGAPPLHGVVVFKRSHPAIAVGNSSG